VNGKASGALRLVLKPVLVGDYPQKPSRPAPLRGLAGALNGWWCGGNRGHPV
jgi:hypothetical protein